MVWYCNIDDLNINGHHKTFAINQKRSRFLQCQGQRPSTADNLAPKAKSRNGSMWSRTKPRRQSSRMSKSRKSITFPLFFPIFGFFFPLSQCWVEAHFLTHSGPKKDTKMVDKMIFNSFPMDHNVRLSTKLKGRGRDQGYIRGDNFLFWRNWVPKTLGRWIAAKLVSNWNKVARCQEEKPGGKMRRR